MSSLRVEGDGQASIARSRKIGGRGEKGEREDEREMERERGKGKR